MAEEEILYEGSIPFRVFYFSHSLLWFPFLGWNLGLFTSWLKSKSWHIKLTSQRVVLTEGIISRDQEEVEYYRVEDSDFEQSIFQRLIGIGTISIRSDDASKPDLSFPIHNPKEFREKIRSYTRKQRKEMKTLQVD